MIPIEDLLPQAAPMVLLSDYEPQTEAMSVAASVAVSPSSPFYETSLGGVPACVTLEYMAQAMALLVGLSRRAKGLPPQLGFVLGSRKLEMFVPAYRKGARYRVTATCTYEDETFGSFDCTVADAEGALCARGTLTAYQPEGAMTPEKLKKYE